MHAQANCCSRGPLLTRVRCGPSARAGQVGWLIASVWLAGATPLLAADPVTIAKLLADPKVYHLRVVTLQGTAHQVHTLAPSDVDAPPVNAPGTTYRFDFQCYFVHPAYTFVLADDTGFLQIAVRGRPPCVSQLSPAEPPEVSEGDKVLIDVQVTVGQRYIEGAERHTLHVLAIGIQRLGN